MPTMGRPVSLKEKAFTQVSIAKPTVREEKQIEDKKREQLLNKLTGFQKESPYATKDKTKLGKDEFLKLLTNQLQNQDPLDPMKQDKMTSELAQFSQLEQLTAMNKKFDGLNKNAQVQDRFYAASFIGKNVVTNGNSLNFKGEGTKSDILFHLERPARRVLVRIMDNSGNIVSEMWKDNIGRGNQTVTWDGKRLDGIIASQGTFSVKVHAWDETTEEIPVATKVNGQVESVFFEDGETVLLVSGRKVFLRDVDSFHLPKTSELNKSKDLPLQQKPSDQNLPTAKPMPNSLQSNKKSVPSLQAKKSYGMKTTPLSTGITDVYDVE